MGLEQKVDERSHITALPASSVAATVHLWKAHLELT